MYTTASNAGENLSFWSRLKFLEQVTYISKYLYIIFKLNGYDLHSYSLFKVTDSVAF